MRPFIKPETIECNIETLTETYGEFIAQPLERGWGTTIGNALRRVLLSSIEGGAITAVRIEGVLHEFTAVSGVKEDITNIILNLKGINLICHSDEAKIVTIKVKGPHNVTAKDIQHDDTIRIINKDQHIATLNEEGKLDVRMIVQKGKGYVPADQNKTDDPLFVPIDAIYSPVLKVNFEVTETRVGEATDFERLKILIWTNGTTLPQDALKSASELLNQHVDLFSKVTEIAVSNTAPAAAVKKGKKEKTGIDALLAQKVVDQEGLSKRVLGALEGMNIKTIKDLVVKKESDLQEGKNFGQKALSEINELLERLNLTLGMKV
jgi:DNA-directed RNA polymerase subunit alpha